MLGDRIDGRDSCHGFGEDAHHLPHLRDDSVLGRRADLVQVALNPPLYVHLESLSQNIGEVLAGVFILSPYVEVEKVHEKPGGESKDTWLY